MAITHAKVSGVSDSGDSTLVQPSDWNDNHDIDLSDYTGDLQANSIDLTPYNGSGSPDITCDTPGDLAVAWSTQSLVYRRIGSYMFVALSMVSSSFTWSTSSGIFYITGLPTAAYTGQGSAAFRLAGWTIAGIDWLTVNTVAGQTYLKVMYSRSGNTSSNSIISHWPSGGSILIDGSILYRVA